jgi:hypothetical protein
MSCKPIQSSHNINEVIKHVLSVVMPRLATCKTKKLRVKILEVLMSCIYYDASLTLALFNSAGSAADEVWLLLFSLLKDMSKPVTHRLIVLSFTNILLMPTNELPGVLLSNFVPMLQQVLRELVIIEEEEKGNDEDSNMTADDDDDGNEAAAGTDDEEDDDEEEEDDDAIEEDDGDSDFVTQKEMPEGGFDEDEDVINAEDEAYKQALEKIEKRKRVKDELRRADPNFVDDDDEGDDEEDEMVFTTPVETIDCVVYFIDALTALNARDAQLVSSLRSQLGSDDASLQQFIELAEQRRVAAAVAAAAAAAAASTTQLLV